MPTAEGLGFFPFSTRLLPTKTTLQRKFTFKHYDPVCQGYEIHMGETIPSQPFSPLNHYLTGEPEGCLHHDRCWGTYIHGIFDNQAVLKDLFKDLHIRIPDLDFNQYKEQQYDQLADLVRSKVDVSSVYKFLQA